MKLVDVNILLYAVNLADPKHNTILQWWEKALTGPEPVGLCWLVLVGFLRIATHPRALSKPLPLSDALGRVDAWLGNPHCVLISETSQHWQTMRSVLESAGKGGNLTADAYLAALAIEHQATLISCDTDFSRFSHLRWENPLAIV